MHNIRLHGDPPITIDLDRAHVKRTGSDGSCLYEIFDGTCNVGACRPASLWLVLRTGEGVRTMYTVLDFAEYLDWLDENTGGYSHEYLLCKMCRCEPARDGKELGWACWNQRGRLPGE